MVNEPTSGRRRPHVFHVHLRDVWLDATGDDPAISLRAAPGIGRIWSATCRVVHPSAPKAMGSGFFIDGGSEGVVAVTNAHVVDNHRGVRLEWVDGAEMD